MIAVDTEDKRVAGGTMGRCPYSKDVEILTFSLENGKPDNFHCEFTIRCGISPCPLAEHVKGKR